VLVRVASFNILHGRSTADGIVDADRFRDAVRTIDADVLGLQEVDRAQARSHGLDLTAIAAEAMGAVDAKFVPALTGTPGEGWHPPHGPDEPGTPAYGVALLSRLAVDSWVTVRLPALPMRKPRDEPRVAVGARLADVTVFTTHLSFLPPWNRVQLHRLLLALRRVPGAQLLTGDLNVEGHLPRALRDWTPLVDGLTFPADVPRVQLDHVLARRCNPTVIATQVLQLPLSDHRAVVVDVTLGR
jgi:endonuclease/exonuclease/phosphatase family metal-dependent hydrolase